MSKKSSSPPKKRAKRSGTGCVIFAGVAVVIGIIAVVVLAFGLLTFSGNNQTVIAPSGLEDDTSPEDVLARREQAEAQLDSFGWVDEAAGVVRIPIDRAMAAVAESGLPVGIEPTETPLPTPTPTVAEVMPTDTPAPDATSEPLPTETPTLEPSATPIPEPAVDLANVSFQEHVLPIFEQSCGMCHGGEEPDGGQRLEEGLNLLDYEGVITGSWNGTVVEPGDVEDSYLVEQVATGRMPKEGDRLTPAEVEIITAWVEAGALNN